jgi:phosphatidylserine/phosphatidylglycerophosphate/cardiolipin synthase-like enzyme
MDKISRATRTIIPAAQRTESNETAETRPAFPVKDLNRFVQKRSKIGEVIPDGILPNASMNAMPLVNCTMKILNGAETQDAAIKAIEESPLDSSIRLMAYTFDYQPLVVVLCAAKAGTPTRRVEVVLDKNQTFAGQTRQQNSMVRQLIEAGVHVRCTQGFLLTPVYALAGRSINMGGLKGALHAKACIIGKQAFVGSANWTVSSRGNQECSMHVMMDDAHEIQFHHFFDRVWMDAVDVSSKELIDKMTEQMRIKNERKLAQQLI